MTPPEAMDKLTTQLKKTESNAEFLLGLKPGTI
jgi:transcription termination factor Rho